MRCHASLAQLLVVGIVPLVLGGGSAGLGAVVDDAGARVTLAETVCPPHTPPRGADLIVGRLSGVTNYDSIDGIEAFSVGTTSCNVGDDEISWSAFENQHPIIAQNMFRLKDDRFEQVGMSWVKHGFVIVDLEICCSNCISSGDNQRLGVGCSDTYSSSLNGKQAGLGARSDINAYPSAFDYPYTGRNQTGDAIFKRLQVKISDIESAQDGGGLYIVEAQYLTPDDAAAGNQDNSASYREIEITGSGADWTADFDGATETQREQAGIRAWQDHDSDVIETDVRVPDEGLFILAAKTTDLGNGMWHYEYALQNLYSDRSAGSFSVPVPSGASLQNVGFHDVDYHSGEIYDGTDWDGQLSGGAITWSTSSFSIDPNANALRWGTLYNFRFDSTSAPGGGEITIGLFKPGTPTTVTAETLVPGGSALVCGDDIIGVGEECDPPDGVVCGGNCRFLLDCSKAAELCDDGNECTDDACEAGECVNTNNTAPCVDGVVCTIDDTCAGGVCVGGPLKTCDGVSCDDCNNNGVDDLCDIANDASLDCDGGPIGNRETGAVLLANSCVSCHGADGSGDIGPDIRDTRRTRLRLVLVGFGSHAGGNFTELTDQDLADLESFLSSGGSRGRPDLIPDECQVLNDCDDSGVPDGCELDSGVLADLDSDGVPDICAGNGATKLNSCGDCGVGSAMASVVMLLGLAWLRGRSGASRAGHY